MTYTLTDGNGTLTKALSSFWFYMPFTIHADGSVQLVATGAADGENARLAVLMDGTANTNRPHETQPNLGAAQYNLTIDHKEHGTLTFGDLEYDGSIEVVRNAEWSEMRLFKGSTVDGRPGWISTNGWNRGPFDENNEDEKDVNNWDRTFSFGGINGAQLDAVTVEKNKSNKPVSVSLVRRLIKNSICAEVQNVAALVRDDARQMPGLQVKTAANASNHTLNDVNLFSWNANAAASGYIMIAAGAFAGISADSMLSDWEVIADAADAKRRLSRVAWAPDNVGTGDGRMLRKLNNIHITDKNGAFAGSGLPTDPVEVLHVRSTGGRSIS